MTRQSLLRGNFFGNVTTLMVGTVVAQAIPVAISPILTRIYTPEEFGILALYISITSIISVIATMRYELAILQPQEDGDAKALMLLSMWIVFGIVVITFLFSILYNFLAWDFLGGDIGGWLYLTPLSVFFVGFYQILSYWSLRKNDYRRISFSRIVQVSGAGVSQVSAGMLSLKSGLIGGYIIGQLLSVLFLIKKTFKKEKDFFGGLDKKIISENAIRYKRMPLFSTLGAFADNTSLQMPVILISRFFGEHITGIFSLTFRMLNLPVSLVSGALTQVLYRKIVDLVNSKETNVYPLIVKLFLGLLLSMVPFSVLVWILAEPAFAFVFGEPWREAGSMASMLVIAVMIRFAVSPLSAVMAMDQNIKLGTAWQLIYLITISCTLFYFSSYGITDFLCAFVVHEIVLYLLYFVMILVGVKNLEKIS